MRNPCVCRRQIITESMDGVRVAIIIMTVPFITPPPSYGERGISQDDVEVIDLPVPVLVEVVEVKPVRLNVVQDFLRQESKAPYLLWTVRVRLRALPEVMAVVCRLDAVGHDDLRIHVAVEDEGLP